MKCQPLWHALFLCSHKPMRLREAKTKGQVCLYKHVYDARAIQITAHERQLQRSTQVDAGTGGPKGQHARCSSSEDAALSGRLGMLHSCVGANSVCNESDTHSSSKPRGSKAFVIQALLSADTHKDDPKCTALAVCFVSNIL